MLMALVTVFEQSLKKYYKSTICSKATYFYVIFTGLSIFLPLLLAFKGQGFWHIYEFCREKPTVLFKHQILLIIETNIIQKPIVWSTFAGFNKNLKHFTRPVTIQHSEWDNNRDGKNDNLDMKINVAMKENENVHCIKLLLFFDYTLEVYSHFKMEALAFIDYSSPLPGSELFIQADLRLYQREPLKHSGLNIQYNQSVLEMIHQEALNHETILKHYAERNVSASLQNLYPVWVAGRAQNQAFEINLKIYYPEETILYELGFWQLIKWAWIQYLSLLLISLFIVHKVKAFIFESHTFCTTVEFPFKKML